jgi:hypothetical protein|tara:strand:+ start:490 stop:714 length:225 start_codon:yes stop_codon:yes gene_type:complete
MKVNINHYKVLSYSTYILCSKFFDTIIGFGNVFWVIKCVKLCGMTIQILFHLEDGNSADRTATVEKATLEFLAI